MKQMSDALLAEIRFQSNYIQLRPTLVGLNESRFRGLGDAQCQAFVRHGVKVADGFDLTRMDSAAYVLFLMHYLGSWFHTDPRFAAIHGALLQAAGETEKLEAARTAFMAHADRYIGETGEISAKILIGYQPHLALVTDSRTSLADLHAALIKGCPFSPQDRAAYPGPAFEAEAGRAAAHLGLEPVLGAKVCLALAFTLGRRFFDDPLYPWVRAKITEAAKSGDDPARVMFDYALKRMNVMLRQMETS